MAEAPEAASTTPMGMFPEQGPPKQEGAPLAGPTAEQGPASQCMPLPQTTPPQQGPPMPQSPPTSQGTLGGPTQQGAPVPAQYSPQGMPPPQQGSPWQGPYYDAATGRYYYYNIWTMQSDWAAPPPMQAMYAPQYAGGYTGYPVMPMPMMGAPLPQDPATYATSTVAYGGMLGSDPLGQALDRREHCSDFKRGKCDRGAACKYAHIRPTEECGDFKRGRCTRGSTCKYLHLGEGGPARSRSRSR
mmetsp:Transcript_66625/g.214688  ORF Transcript_66625/g.214688 Transcript_66625/m.214688 type:complete len:244 (+) Transcript_66625:64-795(+)